MSDDLVSNAWSLTVEVDRLNVALTEARAEIERLRAVIARVARVDNSLATQLRKSIENNAALVKELSTLRARVREVVGGMLAHSCVADAGPDCKDGEDEAAERAARQLMEDLK